MAILVNVLVGKYNGPQKSGVNRVVVLKVFF